MSTAKIQCTCQHEQQDKMYGPGVRLANDTQRKPSPSTVDVRCTVCGKVQTVNTSRVN